MQQYDKEILHSMEMVTGRNKTFLERYFERTNANKNSFDDIIKKFENTPNQFMSDQKKQERPLMPIAMADKTFTVTTTGPYGGTIPTDYTGTLELEGSFAVIRKWEKGELIGIKIIPSHQIVSIDWKPAKTVKL